MKKNQMTAAEIKLELCKLETPALVAYFNILRTPCLGGRASDPKGAVHLPIVMELLDERGLGKVARRAEKNVRRLVCA